MRKTRICPLPLVSLALGGIALGLPACGGGMKAPGITDAANDPHQSPSDAQIPRDTASTDEGTDGGDDAALDVAPGEEEDAPGDAGEDLASDVCSDGPPAVNGAPCGCGQECQSGFCADGVCCESACGGTCQSCNQTGSAGACLPVPAGQDPRDDCPDDGMSTCQKDGLCDGNGACRLYPAGSVCAETSCVGSTQTLRRTCDGEGKCQDAPTQSCAPYLCANDGTCAKTCGGEQGCAPPVACTNGSCGDLPLGAPCTPADKCASGFCVDGVCCESECKETCRSCAQKGAEGKCLPEAAGVVDPGCPMEAAATCGQDGTCDGAGACRKYPMGSECVAVSCEGTLLHGARRCDGAGTCGTSTTVDCAPFGCSGGACRSICAGDGDCAPTAYCDAGTKKCTLRKTNGAMCGGAGECASGFCADGLCCDKACGDVCQACNLPGKLGTCSPVQGADDAPQCTGASTCDASGMCKAKDGQACSSSGSCASTFCKDGFCCENGCSGPCQTCAATPGTCTPIKAADDTPECTGTRSCNDTGVCLNKNGQMCGSPGDCISGFCVDGLCCDSACSGGCQACNLTGKLGTCSTSPMGTVCRAAAGACDVAETCDGVATTCPPDVLLVMGTVCRAAAGACDVAETCSGTSAACPADALATPGTVCRTATPCSSSASCTGSSAACPASASQPNGTYCSPCIPCDLSICDYCKPGTCSSGACICGCGFSRL